MCIISKKLKVSDVREKRLAMRKKVQSQMLPSFGKKSILGLNNFISPAFYEKMPYSISTDSSPVDISQIERNSKENVDNGFFQKYNILEKIGEGGHSTVYKCQNKESEQIFAVKLTRYRDEELIINSQRQFELNKKGQNGSIIHLEELIVDYNKMTTYNVQQFCSFKDLKEELHSKPGKKFSELETTKIVKSLLQTLDYMHSKGICHRDIKPENILYNPNNGQIKVIDLECSKNKKETESEFEMWTKTGTINYQAPQYFLNTTYTQKVDLWAAGIVAYELLTGKAPFDSIYNKKIVQLIVSTQIDYQSLNICSELEILLKGLLEKQPMKRSSVKQALSNCQKVIDSMN